MAKVKIALLILMILMSIAAGGAKLLLMPQEVRTFVEAQLSYGLIVPLGLAQLAGAIMSAFRKTRRYGLLIMSAAFLASAGVILRTGNLPFALVSMIPFIICLWLAQARPGNTASPG